MRKKIIYIAGYGRSGSTILDMILGATDNVVGAGELTYIYDELKSGHSCSCGQLLVDCDVWGSYVKSLDFDLKEACEVVRRVDKRNSLFFSRKKDVDEEDCLLYRGLSEGVFDYLFGRGNVIVIDSSKTAANAAYRPIAIKKILNIDICVIHLQRSFWSVAKSLLKGSNKSLSGKSDDRVSFFSQCGLRFGSVTFDYRGGFVMSMLRGALGYYFANKSARILRAEIGDEYYYHLKYEDFLKNPTVKLLEISEKFNVDFSDSIKILEDKNSIKVGHLIAGNRVSKQRYIDFN